MAKRNILDLIVNTISEVQQKNQANPKEETADPNVFDLLKNRLAKLDQKQKQKRVQKGKSPISFLDRVKNEIEGARQDNINDPNQKTAPKSIFDNVAYGPRIHSLSDSKEHLEDIVITSLKRAGLYDEVSDRLDEPGTSLSGGQQQRLCIARAIAVDPQIILMDEPCSALDPIATAIIEELMDSMKEKYTIVIVTHSMQQAARVSQQTAFFHLGELVESGDTEAIFTNPEKERTQNYISGRIG